jgi:hypothetical protein
MQYGAILHVGISADSNLMHIASQDGVHPDAGVLAQDDVSDQLRGGVHVAGSRNDWMLAFERTNHRGLVATARTVRDTEVIENNTRAVFEASRMRLVRHYAIQNPATRTVSEAVL